MVDSGAAVILPHTRPAGSTRPPLHRPVERPCPTGESRLAAHGATICAASWSLPFIANLTALYHSVEL